LALQTLGSRKTALCANSLDFKDHRLGCGWSRIAALSFKDSTAAPPTNNGIITPEKQQGAG
jgi:hypothetical protein